MSGDEETQKNEVEKIIVKIKEMRDEKKEKRDEKRNGKND